MTSSKSKKAIIGCGGHARSIVPILMELGYIIEGIYDDSYEFELGKASILKEGSKAAIIASGTMVHEALKAHELLKQQDLSVNVVNIHTIKPLDKPTILKSVSKTRAVVTVEEHQVIGGLGGSIAELLSEHYPIPLIRVGMQDRFGE